jgi:hypothetical protein
VIDRTFFLTTLASNQAIVDEGIGREFKGKKSKGKHILACSCCFRICKEGAGSKRVTLSEYRRLKFFSNLFINHVTLSLFFLSFSLFSLTSSSFSIVNHHVWRN